MSSVYDRLPKYLLEKYQLISTVFCTALFSLIFLLLSVPFSNNAWFALGTNRMFLFTLLFFILSAIIVVESKYLMYTRRAREFTILQYILWCAAEVIAISMLYAIFTVESLRLGYLESGDPRFMPHFFSAIVYVSVSLGVPYALCALHFTVVDKDNTIRLMNYGNVVSDTPIERHEEKRITLFDNNGVLKFSINSENLYYIESDDNYIKVWYTDTSAEMKQYMLRCRLKTVEDSFADSELVRCHRKYIVNITKVQILRAEKDGYRVDLGLDNQDPIPVSKTYEQNFLTRFNSR